MGIQISRQKDNRFPVIVIKKTEEIPNGLGLACGDLGGEIVYAGTIIGKDGNGLGRVVKSAKVNTTAGAADVVYKVVKGHHFKVGQIVKKDINGASQSVTITAIDKTGNATYDSITVSGTLGAITANAGFLVEADAVSATAKVKYTPIAVLGDSYDVVAGSNLQVSAVLTGVFSLANAPASPLIPFTDGFILSTNVKFI